jgi:apolipoprotein N-acyltransferase
LNDSFFSSLKDKLKGNKNPSIIGGLYSFSLADNDTVFYNTAFFLNRDTVILRHKSKLVIGVEKMPFEDILLFLKHFNFNFGGLNNSLSVDNQALNFIKSDNSFSAGTIVCYESIYGEFVSEFVKRNAGLLILITNDAWWGNTPAYHQIRMHSKLRAVENRRYLIRAGNTGISCIINPKGDIVKEIKPLTENAFTCKVPQTGSLSFYVRHGDYIGILASFCSTLILLLTIYTIKFRKHRPLKM